MKSSDYRSNISNIVRKALHRKFPGLKKSQVTELCRQISVSIHARFYGANVDGVESPIWRDDPNHAEWYKDKQPTKTAQEMLNDLNECGNCGMRKDN